MIPEEVLNQMAQNSTAAVLTVAITVLLIITLSCITVKVIKSAPGWIIDKLTDADNRPGKHVQKKKKRK